MNGTLHLFPEDNIVVEQLTLELIDVSENRLPGLPDEDFENIADAFESVGNYGHVANGDCLDRIKELPTDSVNLVLTDPPYNLGLFMHNRQTNLNKMRENHFAYSGWDDLSFDVWEDNMRSFFRESNRILKKRGSLLMFMSLIKVETIIKLAQEHGFYYKTVGIWHRDKPDAPEYEFAFCQLNRVLAIFY